MGVTCKPTGKFASMLRKVDNQLEAEKKTEKKKVREVSKKKDA